MDTAIIGVSFRFPGANDSSEYWANLAGRRSSVSEVPAGRWDWRLLWGDPKLDVNKTSSKWGGFIDDVDAFDHEFFGLLPKVVHNMDPQQRIMLELAWSCLEDAGKPPSTLRGRPVGVFVGVTHHDYKELLASAKVEIEPYHYTGTATVVVPNRISHIFGLRGPSLPIDTGCSSSLNAIHAAIQSFERGECEMALAGGISLILNPARHVSVSKMGTLSPTGSCKTLDERADGYVRGEGAGFFLLKPLDRALVDGDRIYGVIKGSAINHCGETHTLSYPSAEAQADVIVAAHECAGVPVSSVNFIELHGTGTPKGDPIEFEGLRLAYRRLAQRQGIALDAPFCGLSSAKSNIGHLEAAAGMAGVVKVLLAFQHRTLPGFHDFQQLNSRVTLDGTPFYILDETRPWSPVDAHTPLRAGVSSFGFGGTNAHLILEAPPEPTQIAKSRRKPAGNPACLIALSARTADALQRRRDDLLAWLDADGGQHALAEISRALLLQRDHLSHRFACVVDDPDALRAALRAPMPANAVAALESEVRDAMRAEAESLLARRKHWKKKDTNASLQRLAQLFLDGGDVPWPMMFEGTQAQRLQLPTYPFARHRFWLPDTRVDDTSFEDAQRKISTPALHDSVEMPASLADSLYRPHWQHTDAAPTGATLDQVVLVGVSDDVDKLESRLRASSRFASTRFERIVLSTGGRETVQRTADALVVDPEVFASYEAAVAALRARGMRLERILLVPPRASAVDTNARIAVSARHVFALVKAMLRGTKSARFVQLAPQAGDASEYVALDGFFKTLRIEKPSFTGRVLSGAAADDLQDRFAEIVADELLDGRDTTSVRYVASPDDTARPMREVLGYATVPARVEACAGASAFREGGTYLITGGLGGIGRIVARHVCARYRGHVYLTGRSALTDGQRDIMAALCADGGSVSYLACDPAHRDEVRQAIAAVHADGRRLNGVLHSAGMIQDSFLLLKSPEDFARVLAPKTVGTTNLDQETRDEPLDMFVVFSSIAGVMGNVGQGDYAYGNAFKDAFAHWREQARARGERHGRSLSINWPFWRNGGMRMGEAEIAAVRRSFGIVPLEDEAGLDALEFGLAQSQPQLIVMPGDAAHVRESMGIVISTPVEAIATAPVMPAVQVAQAVQVESVAERALVEPSAVSAYLAGLFANELRMSSEFDPDKSFKDYGVDSVVMIELISLLEKSFGTLPKTLLFEYPTLSELSGYFHEQHNAALADLLNGPAVASIAAAAVVPGIATTQRARPATFAFAANGVSMAADDPIVVVGLAGRYPQAETLEAFWENLSLGRDCIEEIPEERPDVAAQFRLRPGEPTRAHAYANWGGFLRDVDRFDAMFFNISPMEAEDLDPNERLLLEIAAHAIEDAGYTPATLTTGRGYREHPVGVYVGVMWGDYQLHGVDRARDAWVTPHAGYWAVANRISYQFNFSGPSMAVDTACSSSLTAIHLACQALRQGEIDVAIAGAVNLSLHANKYNLLADMHMLAKDGRCRAFGADGTGYVPGEGVGAVVLKPLSSARRDGDHIYGIIRGTSVNHGGKASGFTVPSPRRQAALIQEALDVSGVDPRHISYIEAHGTGTSLGDPIEISGLTKAFAQSEYQYCAIGSAKANIGHLEGAAGIAGLTKVLLQMRHRMLVPSIHSDTLNPYIDFEHSPFRVQHSLAPWLRPTIERDGVSVEVPRLAGLSSFGAGGANGHVIIEEYIDDVRADAVADAAAVFVLSARKEAALRTMALQLAERLHADPAIGMLDAAYTLQIGRIAHEFRIAFVVNTRTALLEALRAYAEHGTLSGGAWSGHRDAAKRDPAIVARLNAAIPQIPGWLAQRDLPSLARHWVDGAAIDWASLYPAGSRRRVPLPGYAFQRQRYWVEAGPAIESTAVLHPLIDANVSTLEEQAYSKLFRPDEFFLRDHRLGDNRVLPGVAYLEMAVQAATLAAPGRRIAGLQDVHWLKPVVLDMEPMRMRIVLTPDAGGIGFELHAVDDEARKPYAHGTVRIEDEARKVIAPERVDIAAVMRRSTVFERAQIDAVFAAMGFTFGSSFQVYDALYCNEDEALGSLRLPPIPGVRSEDFALHPALLDGATRACLGVGGLLSAESVVHVPVKLRRVDIFGTLGDRAFAYARRVPDVQVGPQQQCFDVLLCDADGNVRIRLVQLIGQAAPQLALVARRAQAGAMRPPLPVAVPEQKTVARAVAMTVLSMRPAGTTSPVDAATALLVELLAGVTKVPADQIDPNAQLENYGIDSMMIATLNRELDSRFGAVPKTLFFEYQDLAGVASYLAEQHADALGGIAPAAALAPAATAPMTVAMAESLRATSTAVDAVDADAPRRATVEFLQRIVAESTGLASIDVDPLSPMENYGIDSMMIVELTRRIEQTFGPVSKTLFFEYQEIDSLAGHLADSHPQAALGLASSVQPAPPPVAAVADSAPSPATASNDDSTHASAAMSLAPAMAPSIAPSRGMREFRRLGRHSGARDRSEDEDIAIVGLSGHYPGANDLQTFWRNLSDGRDCIVEVPASRWDHQRFYNPDRSHKGTAYSQWGGFMDDIDLFDARFFNISAREAEVMDPQERLFLQTAWECLEDACHTRQSLKGQSVGVFVGVAWQYYAQFEVSDEQLKSGRPSTPVASIANRVSYFMNFNGPSLVLDTMCSSSLTAIHLSCRAINNGDCDLALAGGVNVMPHPNKYLQLSTGQFLSTDGRCRAFGTGGDGYVPGEGVGAVLLKRLSQAIADGDHIYGVIKGSALNHGGKTNGFTVPNQAAQTDVIGKALKRSGWDPDSIDYIEAHGTGTSLGDPIEIAGLSRAFANTGAEFHGAGARIAPQTCRIGSIKSNIGHLESAAAIAGLTKILLQFRHNAIAPSLHSSALNPAIDFPHTPFRVVQQAETWRAQGGQDRRRAGLSSFGAGGSNAHCLVEDYPRPLPATATGRPALFVLSADCEERLSRTVERVVAFLERGGDPDVGLDLAALAYSSQVGREAMEERLAVVATSIDGLTNALRAYRDTGAADAVQRGSLRKHAEKLESIVDDAEKDALIRALIGNGRLQQLARAWISMLDIDWNRYADALYATPDHPYRPQRMPFPTMPFLAERHWIEEKRPGSGSIEALHPLIDRNISSLSVQAYHKRFDGSEFFLREHIVHTDRDRKILPGAAYLEMARAAGDLAAGEAGLRVDRIRDLMWMHPFEIADRPDGLTVRMHDDGDALRFEMVRDSDAAICVEGELSFRNADDAIEDEWIDIAATLARATLIDEGTDAIYGAFHRMGFRFGPSFQVTQARYALSEGALCRLRLPAHLLGGLADYGMHPAMIDAVLRSGLTVLGDSRSVPIVPFALEEMEYRHPLTEACFVHVVSASDAVATASAPAPVLESAPESTIYKCDLTVTDADGRVLAKLRGVAGRALVKPSTTRAIEYYRYEWSSAALNAASGGDGNLGATLLLTSDRALADAMARRLPAEHHLVPVLLVASGDEAGSAQLDAIDVVDPTRTESVDALFASLRARALLPDRIVYWLGDDDTDAVSANDADRVALHRGIQSVRRLFAASEKFQPAAHVRMLYAYREGDLPQPHHDAVFGFARSLLTVNHRFEFSTLRHGQGDVESCAAAIVGEFTVDSGFGGNEIAWRDGRRYRRTPCAMDAALHDDATTGLPLRERGTYLITGGGGKLGLLIAHWMAEKSHANLLLSGRSSVPSDSLRQSIEALRALGARVEYRSCDIADADAVAALVASAQREFGALHGVIHCAGVSSDRSVLDLDDAEFTGLLTPKIDGTVLLDRATADQPLDFFVAFSSVSALIGDLGSCAYAAGNRFMDSFASWRETLRARGLRQGRSLSIDWPLWASGGMEITGSDASVLGFSGMQALTAAEGIAAFERILHTGHDCVLVSVGDPGRIAKTLRLHPPVADATASHDIVRTMPVAPATPIAALPPPNIERASKAVPTASADLQKRTEHYIKTHMATVAKTRVEAIDSRASFEQCGMDSVLMLELHTLLRAEFEGLPKTALFEYDTAERMARYLIAQHGEALHRCVGIAAAPAATTSAIAPAKPAPAVPRAIASPARMAAVPSRRAFALRTGRPAVADEGIAIIGIAGEFPSSPDLAHYWNHLRSGDDCLTRIPDDRGFASSLNLRRSRSGKPIADKGGFIADVDLFDPQLFRMSHAEADRADPQLRVLLRTAWRAVEDAAYTPEALAASRVGVFVGTMNDDFTRIAAELQTRSADYLGPGSVSSELSNRLSFLMDFCGPSLTVSTACSASLTALHLARQSILSGDCEVALVGGVNLSLHNSKYQLLHDMNVLSPDGQERTFDEAANGLVPSEGVGIAVLKPLTRALADGDHVYGVIRASRIGHSGTGAGQFMPNLRVMEETAADCIRDAGIAAVDVSYIETHGTGTELGDPIELKALANALRRTSDAVGYCAIGSKANIGHMEAASGMGSLIKVLLSMRHGEVAPCAKLTRINSSFAHVGSPFRFPTEASTWPALGDGRRYAGINSFGMGGSNAFVIVESPPVVPVETGTTDEPAMFVLSARSAEGLRAYAHSVVAFVRERIAEGMTSAGFADLAYSSQTGRIACRHRMALVARDATAFVDALDGYLRESAQRSDGVFVGDTQSPAAADMLRLLTGDAGDGFVDTLLHSRQWHTLAELWVRGASIDWYALHRSHARRRAPFPGMPFELVRCDLRNRIDAHASLPLSAPHHGDDATGIADPAPIREDAWIAHGPSLAAGWCRLTDLSSAFDALAADALAADALAADALAADALAADALVPSGAETPDESLRRYWIDLLGDVADTSIELGKTLSLEAPGDLSSNPTGAPEGELHCVSEVIDIELVKMLQEFGARHGIALETLVSAAWAVLVNRYTKARSSQFGLLGAMCEPEAVLLPVRVRTAGRQKILEWLSELQANLLRKHRDGLAPLESIGEWVGHDPLFDTVIVFDEMRPDASLNRVLASESYSSRPRMELVALTGEDSLELSLIYRAATPDYASAGMLLEQFKVLLEGIVSNPDRMPSALGMRTKAESRERFWKTMEAALE